MAKHRPLSSVLIKPTGPDCNLDCTHCFYLEKEKPFPKTRVHMMSPEIQEEMIQQLMHLSGDAVLDTYSLMSIPQREIHLNSDLKTPRVIK